MVPDLSGSVTVAAPIQRAFDVFTKSFGTWWPSDYHIGAADIADAIIEPRVGGRWFERGADGSECDWGTVLEFSPPNRVVLAWHLDPSWSYDPNPERASRVEVTFADAGDGTTRVELVHSHIERHGTGWQKIRDSVNAADGWSEILGRFGAAAG